MPINQLINQILCSGPNLFATTEFRPNLSESARISIERPNVKIRARKQNLTDKSIHSRRGRCCRFSLSMLGSSVVVGGVGAKTSSETVFENPNLEPNPSEFNPCIEFTLKAEILFTKKR